MYPAFPAVQRGDKAHQHDSSMYPAYPAVQRHDYRAQQGDSTNLHAHVSLPQNMHIDQQCDKKVNKEEPMIAVLNKLVLLQKESALPLPEIDLFDGTDLLKYQSFMKNFKMVVEQGTEDPIRRLELLLKYTRGQAHELIRDCPLIEDTQEAYTTALELLKRDYGHPAILAAAYKSKAEQWPRITGGDKEGFKRFSTFITNCLHAKLNNTDMNTMQESCQ